MMLIFQPRGLMNLTILILLCRVHHKIIDDQTQTYTVEVLRKMKTTHEAWVASTLIPSAHLLPKARFRRVKENIPAYLPRLTSGKDVLDIIQNTYAHVFDHDEPATEDEAQLLAEFFQEAQDYGDLYNDLEAGERAKAAFRMSDSVQRLEDAGFWVFGGKEIQRLEIGSDAPKAWPIVILHIRKSTSLEVIEFNSPTPNTKVWCDGCPWRCFRALRRKRHMHLAVSVLHYRLWARAGEAMTEGGRNKITLHLDRCFFDALRLVEKNSTP